MRFRHIWDLEPRPVALCLDCAIGENTDHDPSLIMRSPSRLWTYIQPNICPCEEWGKPRVLPVCYIRAERLTRLEWEGYDQVALRVVHEASA